MMRKILALMLAVILLATWLPAMADGYSDMLAKGEAYCASGDYTKAIASYQLAQKLQPDHVEAFLGEANVYIILGDYYGAVSLVEAALEIDPVSSDAWHMKCKIDVLLNDVVIFEQDAVFAEVCDVDLSDMCLQIASMYSSMDLNDQAVRYFAMADPALLNETQKGEYRKALVKTGNRETAEKLGLMSSPIRNTRLDAAFETGDLTLIQTGFPAITGGDFAFPDEMWEALGTEKPADPASVVDAALSNATVSWLSLSPAGNSGILAIADAGVCYYEGKYHVLFPSRERGVEDTHGNLAKISHMRLQVLLDKEGVIYSPDGRYAAIYSTELTLMRAQFLLDPYIIDLSTGEMFLTATYGNQMAKEEAGAVSTAAFSADGKYLYYMFYGNIAEHRTALYRYNLQENTTEICYSGSDLNYWPTLSETGNGSFIILRDARRDDEKTGITDISYENGNWRGTEHYFDLPLMYWYCNRLMYSANSGYAFIPGRTRFDEGPTYAFQRIRPDEDFAGMNQYCVISKETNQIQAYSEGEIISLFEPWVNMMNREDALPTLIDRPFQEIMAVALSPDGYYALLYTFANGLRDNYTRNGHLYLVRLDDLAIKEVRGIDPSAIMVGALGKDYKPLIEWNTDTLIIGTSDGIQAYQFAMP